MPRRRLTVVLAIPLLAAVALAGCTGDGSGPEAPGSAGEPTERSDRLREELTGACPADAADQPADQEAPSLAWLDVAPDASDEDALQSAADGARQDLGLTVSVGARDHGGEATTAGAGRSYPSASMSKVPVAMAYLQQLRASGQEPADADRALLDAALVSSDNDAASALYAALGPSPADQRAALQATYELLGIEDGVPTELPGLNPTTVEDQLDIVSALQDPPEQLHPDDAALITELMAVPAPGRQTPDESKDFGVGSLALPLDDPAAADVHVKNGWIDDVDGGSGLWSAGTVGYATVQDTDMDLVVLLDGAPSAECAFSALDAVTHVGMQTAGS